jgi:hypothetical protein
MKPVLTDFQMRLVERAARGLGVEVRDNFLKTVADHLNGDPSDAAVNAAINIALDRLPLFLCDNTPAKQEKTHGPPSP